METNLNNDKMINISNIVLCIPKALQSGNYDQFIIDTWEEWFPSTNWGNWHMREPSLFELESILRLCGIHNGTESHVIIVATQIALTQN